ncbi:MAG: hypothetical protein LBK56_09110 [Gracilibacteraceae bacterium]|nr:hypothetical protein [Gracilibacteraceae bacterium]
MKKYSALTKLGILALIAAIGFAFAACGSSAPPAAPQTSGETPEVTPGETPEITPDDAVDVPNPLVESTGDEISGKLGFDFYAPDEFAKSAQYSMIGDKVASMTYVMETGKGPVNVVYRASRTETDEALAISGDFNSYPKTETAELSGGQQITVYTSEGTGPALILWYNENIADGGAGVSASLALDPVVEPSVLPDFAEFFVTQESKG